MRITKSELRRIIKEELSKVVAEKKKKKSSGKKDACYHKVRARYDVWPSAYASGALVKCRKVGAANWGKSTKKEELELNEEELEDSEKSDLKTMKKQLTKSSKKHAKQADQAKDIAKASEKSSKLHTKQADKLDKIIDEAWSRAERKKRKSKCDNPKGFTMKQFCKNQRTKSKKGEKKNE